MTGDAAYEAFAAFLAACTPEDAARDREAHLTDVERRMLAAARNA